MIHNLDSKRNHHNFNVDSFFIESLFTKEWEGIDTFQMNILATMKHRVNKRWIITYQVLKRYCFQQWNANEKLVKLHWNSNDIAMTKHFWITTKPLMIHCALLHRWKSIEYSSIHFKTIYKVMFQHKFNV